MTDQEFMDLYKTLQINYGILMEYKKLVYKAMNLDTDEFEEIDISVQMLNAEIKALVRQCPHPRDKISSFMYSICGVCGKILD